MGAFSASTMVAAGTVVKASKESFTDAFEPLTDTSSSVITRLVLFPVQTTMVDVRDAAAEVSIQGGGKLTIPEDGLVVRSTGMPPDGPVEVQVAYVAPALADEGMSPVPMQVGEDPLKSYGMVEATIMAGDEEVDVVEGMNLELELPAAMDDPMEVPLWYYDEDRGIWVQEGAPPATAIATAPICPTSPGGTSTR
ncbi:MAG: hypothetical protein R3F43_10880 [bacterium]